MSDHKKSKIRFSSKIVVASVSAVLFYTIFIFFLELLNIKYGTNIQVPVDLTAAWYTFWTVELVCLASIRKTKIKNKYEYDDPDREKGMSEIIEGLRRIGEGTEVVTPSTRQAPVEVFVGQSPAQSQQVATPNTTVSNIPTTVVPTTYSTSAVNPTAEVTTTVTNVTTQEVPVQTIPAEPVTDDEADFEPMTEYYNPEINPAINNELDESLPTIEGKHFNDAFPNDEYITGG